jgi:hypothetical protein
MHAPHATRSALLHSSTTAINFTHVDIDSLNGYGGAGCRITSENEFLASIKREEKM